MVSERWLLTFNFLVILTTHYVSVASQLQAYNCTNQKYKSESLFYRNDLNSLLRSISSSIDDSGFYHSFIGQVNAIVLCRGDIQPAECRGCVDTVAYAILQLCPNQTQAIRWSENCMLRYSDEPIFETLANRPTVFLRNPHNVTSPGKFKEIRRTLMDELRGQAANGGPLRKVAAKSRVAPGSQTIYAMVQCTPDLSAEDCTSCLVQAAQKITECCDAAIGVTVYKPSCFIRYENVPFYNITRLQEPIEPPSSPSSGEAIDDISTVESIQYDFGQIRDATDDFSHANKLGQGGFGTVYKGKLVNGREIAVKRLSRNLGQGDPEFKNEVLLVARLQHRNLVRLLGFSIEGSERLLVYEFHRNGSLDQFIFDPIKSSCLNWEARYKIIWGVARGLLYLHEDSRLRIIHRDLKASNVLLDEEMNPKISDFGMAKLIMPDGTQESTSRVVGTYGYMAPEYAYHGHFSIKSDVYSFGVLVLEILSGQKKVHFQNEENLEDLLSYAWRSWRFGLITSLIDPTLSTTFDNHLDILRCIHIALLCVQENVADRPTMASVVLMLNSFSLTLPLPSKPAFYMPSNFSNSASLFQEYNSKEESSSSSKSKTLAQAAYLSKSDLSIAKLYSR